MSPAATILAFSRIRRSTSAIPWRFVFGGVAIMLLVGLSKLWTYYFHRAAILEVEHLGGRVQIAGTGPGWLRDWVADEWMRTSGDVEAIVFSGAPVTDAQLKVLNNFKSIKELHLL